MRKKSKVLIVLLICLSVSVLSIACTKIVKIESAVVKNNTVVTTIARGEILNTSALVAVFKYTDGTTKEIGASELTIGSIDTTETGVKKLSITYDKFTFTVDINVVASEADVNTILSLESSLLTDFTSNKSLQTNKQEEFYDRTQALYVGDDNAFHFRINASGVDGSGRLVTDLHKVRTNVKVELKEGSVYTELTGVPLQEMVTVDTELTTLDFTEEAIGKTFKVTVSAVNRDEDYEESQTKFTAELQVIDGFNVYTAKELSVYNNR